MKRFFLNLAIFRKKNNFRWIEIFQSVGMKLFLTFFISILAFVSVLGYFSSQTSKQVIQEKVSNNSHETIIKSSENLDFNIAYYELMLKQIAGSTKNLLHDYINEPKDTQNKFEYLSNLQGRLNQLISGDANLISVHIFDVNGNQIAFAGTDFTHKKTITENHWFQQVINEDVELVWIETYEEGFFQRSTMGLAYFHHDANSSYDSVYMLEIDIKHFSNFLDQIVMGKDDEIMVVNEDGKIIYSTVAGRIGADVQLDLFTEKKIKNEPESNQLITENEEGIEQLIVYERLITGWYLIGTVPVAEIIEGTERIFQYTLNMNILAALFAVGIGIALVYLFGQPLRYLRDLMMLGQQGDLSVRSKMKRKDEIGQLSEHFNKMMEQINLLAEQTKRSAEEVLDSAANLSEVSRKTAQSAQEISVATEQIAHGASSLAMEAEKGNEMTRDIMLEIQSVVRSNQEMGKSAKKVQEVSEQGIEYMVQLIEKTNSTEQLTKSMTEKVDRLKESTGSIRQILDMLTGISQQTNILSLNATIEAARAGEAGKGFVVIADEIRKLADQSRQSIEVVGRMTENIQNEIEETVQALSEAAPLFKEQTESVREADLIFKNVQTQMKQFITRLDEVTDSILQLEQSQQMLADAMNNVSSVSQESSATSEQVASLASEQLSMSDRLVKLADELESLSTNLQKSLNQFKV